MPNETPEWVLETPREFNYILTMCDPLAGAHLQEVDLDRDEFILLKRAIAIVRGQTENDNVHRDALLSLIPEEETEEENDMSVLEILAAAAGQEHTPNGETKLDKPLTPEPAVSAAEVPEWINYESDNWFELSEYIGSSGETVIDLTHSEFHKLKAHLAGMRGYAVEEESHE